MVAVGVVLARAPAKKSFRRRQWDSTPRQRHKVLLLAVVLFRPAPLPINVLSCPLMFLNPTACPKNNC